MLLEDVAGAEAATDVAARIADALSRPLTVGEHELFVSASVGVGWSGLGAGDDPPAGAGDLLRESDIAMYQAKNGGKARCAVFDRRMNAEAMQRMELEGDLRHAIAADELVLHYQPIVSLDSGALQEVEALVRWQHPRHGLIPPLTFIPIAEETGLIVPLGAWVLREACRQTRAWQREHPLEPPVVVGVNLSARQLEQPDLVAQVSAVLAETGLPAASLKLEITESVMMGNTDVVIARMRAAQGAGRAAGRGRLRDRLFVHGLSQRLSAGHAEDRPGLRQPDGRAGGPGDPPGDRHARPLPAPPGHQRGDRDAGRSGTASRRWAASGARATTSPAPRPRRRWPPSCPRPPPPHPCFPCRSPPDLLRAAFPTQTRTAAAPRGAAAVLVFLRQTLLMHILALDGLGRVQFPNAARAEPSGERNL